MAFTITRILGSIDDVRIYSSALSAQEVLQLLFDEEVRMHVRR